MIPSFVGQISYTNTKPFFFEWNEDVFPIISGTPRELAHLAKNERIIAGPLPLVECWKLEDRYKPLKNWGISVQHASNSVFVLSKEPLSQLNNVTVGITTESITSVALFELIIRKRYGHHVMMKRGFGEDDAAWLVIGDQALQYGGRPSLGRWTHVTDLALEWHAWTQLPCVFAKWVVHRNVPQPMQHQLEQAISVSLSAGLSSLDTIASLTSKTLKTPSEQIVRYLKGFTYELGDQEKKAEQQLKEWLYDPIQLN